MRETLKTVSPTVPEGADKGLLTVAELAAFLNVNDQTLRKWCVQGRIPHGRLEGSYRFDRDQVQAWLDERWKTGDPSPQEPPSA